jgi:sulfur carrier protein ThiS
MLQYLYIFLILPPAGISNTFNTRFTIVNGPEVFCIRTAPIWQTQAKAAFPLWSDASPKPECPAKEDEMMVSLPDGSRKEMAQEGASIEEILRMLDINPEEVIVAKNGRIVPEDETAGGCDELRIVRFVHGG